MGTLPLGRAVDGRPVTLLDSQISDEGHKLPFFNDAKQHLIITNFQVYQQRRPTDSSEQMMMDQQQKHSQKTRDRHFAGSRQASNRDIIVCVAGKKKIIDPRMKETSEWQRSHHQTEESEDARRDFSNRFLALGQSNSRQQR